MTKQIMWTIFALMGNILFAQQDSLMVKYDTAEIVTETIEESDLEVFKNDPKFDYEIVKKTDPDWWVSFKNWLGGVFMKIFEWIFGIEKATGAFNSFLSILPFLLLGVLIFILIKFFLNINSRSIKNARKNQALVSLSEEEHIIKNENIESLIEKALSDNDYRLAIRYYYLLILQLMTDKDIIKWELQKTNEDYLTEISEAKLQDSFSAITRFYNYIWYGDFPLDEPKFNRVVTSFVALKKVLYNA